MTDKQFRILLVDDESDILEFLSYNLRREGYEVQTSQNGTTALQIAKSMMPHLIILDIMMPGMDGIETCREIRKMPDLEDVLVMFLTARAEDYSQIAGLDAGADDYVTKPVRPAVLVSRVNAMLRRLKKPGAEESLSDTDRLFIDREKFLVTRNGKEIILPRKEFELLELLASKPGKVFTREEIFSVIWGNKVIVSDRTIDVHIRNLRRELGMNIIKTVKGVGYKFVVQ